MKTKLGLLLLMLLIAVGCDDSTHLGQTAEQPQPEPQPDPVPADLPVIELPSFTNTLDMAFKEIPAGTFTMGGSTGAWRGRQDGEHQHKVTITKPFYMQTTEVTQGQWKRLMASEPWKGKQYVKEGANYAATYVSWNDAVAYCKKLSEKESKTYRLPTEAEWEYACRAGTKTAWSFGDDENKLGDYAWHKGNSNTLGWPTPQQVGLKKPNPWGLYDMHGNVWEWCHDFYGHYPLTVAKDPQGALSPTTHHVARGDSTVHTSWLSNPRSTRSAARTFATPLWQYHFKHALGFRVVRELD